VKTQAGCLSGVHGASNRDALSTSNNAPWTSGKRN